MPAEMSLPPGFRLLRPDEHPESTLSYYLTVPVRDDAGCWSQQPIAISDIPVGAIGELTKLAADRARASGRRVTWP
jgi:hypothetical protein